MPTTERKGVDAYEGLIHTHALRVLGKVDGDLDDIRQVYRMKAWYAIERWKPGGMTMDRWVFGALRNMEKDLLGRKRHGEVFIEDQPARVRRRVDGSVSHEAVYGAVDEGQPLVPNTLTQLELLVMTRLYEGYRRTEIAKELILPKAELEGLIRGIRVKMEDWRPTEDGPPRRLRTLQVETGVAA